MSKILLIGAFGDGNPTSSGQIIRTQITYEQLKKRYGAERVLTVNTTASIGHKVLFARQLFFGLLRSKNIMVIVSDNGMRVLYPVLERAAKLLGKNVLNSIVGGTVKPILRGYPQCRGAMRSFAINWVQLPAMVEELAEEGIYNTEVLPNSKPITPVRKEDIRFLREPPYRFCTFSRISKEKGTEAAIRAIIAVNEKGIPATLDIYGKADEGYEETFCSIIEKAPHYIKYCGIVPYDQSVELLKDYYMMLFPTTFDGEGFPGTLVDALFAGLPVIATDWKHNGEILRDGQTGLLYDHRQENMLSAMIEKAVSSPEKTYRMRLNCVKEAEKYSIESVMDIISSRIEE